MRFQMKTHSVDGENEGFWKRWFDLHITYILHNALKKRFYVLVWTGENDIKTLVWT